MAVIVTFPLPLVWMPFAEAITAAVFVPPPPLPPMAVTEIFPEPVVTTVLPAPVT